VKILVVDDEKSMHVALLPFLTGAGHEAETALSADEGRRKAGTFKPDLILLDLYLPDITGMELLVEFRRDQPFAGVVMMTASAGIKTAVEAIKAGAEDYLQKPLNLDDLQIVLDRYVQKQGLRQEVAALRKCLREQFANEFLFLPDPAMQEVYDQIEKLARQEKVTALILGETGTGKQHVAKLIHFLSERAAKPFVELHCGALPETLMESELFGYEPGAFTDARRQKKGLFEEAQGGSLFLDEVGEMTPSTQTKLLKVLEEKKLRHLGGVKEITLDVRVIAATNRDLEAEVQAGRFRADLYYRLNVIPIKMPPLRSRLSDISELARFFWKEACLEFDKKLDPLPEEVLERFRNYPWPGNVRELKNAVNRMAINASDRRVGLADLPDEIADYDKEKDDAFQAEEEDEASVPEEKEKVLKALRECHWNKSETAKKLGISRKTLFNKIRKYRIH
jgi:two-component system response regulator AtoC